MAEHLHGGATLLPPSAPKTPSSFLLRFDEETTAMLVEIGRLRRTSTTQAIKDIVRSCTPIALAQERAARQGHGE